MEDAISNGFTSISHLKDYNKIDEGFNFKLLDDCRDYLSENSFSPESDLDSELEKCYKILDFKSKMELERNSDPDECNIESFIPEVDYSNFGSDLLSNSPCVGNNIHNRGGNQDMSARSDDFLVVEDDSLSPKKSSQNLSQEIDVKTNFESELLNEDKTEYDLKENLNFVGNSSPTTTCRMSLGSKLEISNALNQNLNTTGSFLNMAGQQLLHLKSSLNSLNKDFNLVEEKYDIESESSSSMPESQISIADNVNKNFDIEDKNKILSTHHKIISNKTKSLSKESNSEVSLNDDANNVSLMQFKNFKLNKHDCKVNNVLNNNTNINQNNKSANKNTANPESHKIDALEQGFLKNDEFKNDKELEDYQEAPKKGAANPESNKTDTNNQEVLKNGELKNDKAIKDYLEDEKEDLINPEWEAIKNLTTNEERYQQVRKCWGSRKIPDPNKNLTYHSYRKRLIGSGCPEPRIVAQHKRQASTNLDGRSAKRPCTFFLDREINTIEKIKENEMHNKISIIDELRYEREIKMQQWGNPYGYSDSRLRNAQLHHQFNARVSVIADDADTCESEFNNKIWTLNERRNEVLKFYGFYKGLNVSNNDPTQLTETQFQELDEIEDCYRQLDSYYKG